VYDLSCSAEPVQELAFLAEQLEKPRNLERDSQKMPRHKSREVIQLRGNRKNQKEIATEVKK